MLQHERDEEGEEYADKEKFVTTAYKRQMEGQTGRGGREGSGRCVYTL
jgi:hypothetical protein